MNPKYILVTPIGTPVAHFNRIETAFAAAQNIVATRDKYKDVTEEMKEDGDVLLDSGFSIFKTGKSEI